jgi:hypothetical protein
VKAEGTNMHEEIQGIPSRILEVALGALIQANHHAVFYDPQSSGWPETAILSSATAAELLLKAIVAKEHPLLIFKDLFELDSHSQVELTVDQLIQQGKTYGFDHMPKLLWVTTGERIPDLNLFDKLRRARNSIQHFCSPGEKLDLRELAREFIYVNIDPLLHRHFDVCAVELHQDHDVGYDYVVDCLLQNELLFSVPTDFTITEFDFKAKLNETSISYQKQLKSKFHLCGIDINKL